LEKTVKQVKTHFRWIRSFRYLRISTSLGLLFVLFALINASLFLLAKPSEDVQAQNVPVVLKATPKDNAVPVATSPSTTTAAPAPAPKPAIAKAAPAPAYDKISIASIGLSSRFVTVGLTSTNAIDVNPNLVGWWNGSAQPGTSGAAFLDGHNPGIFSKLPSIREGAQITLTKASGETFNYTVVHIETVQLAGINMRAALSVYGDATEGLNLMTCVGTYNKDTGTTDQRLVVYAIRS
jgi:sortase (surface protein transpeptidase)